MIIAQGSATSRQSDSRIGGPVTSDLNWVDLSKMKKQLCFGCRITFYFSFLFLFHFSVLHHPILADTDVNGTITENTTWGLNGSPYILIGDLHINSGVTLTVEHGVEIETTYNNAEIQMLRLFIRDFSL